jgi:hypothetical protein
MNDSDPKNGFLLHLNQGLVAQGKQTVVPTHLLIQRLYGWLGSSPKNFG